jgi:hypothetical protein
MANARFAAKKPAIQVTLDQLEDFFLKGNDIKVCKAPKRPKKGYTTGKKVKGI